MKFSDPSALAAAPSAVRSWSLEPSFFPKLMLLGSPSSIIARQRALANRMLEQTDRMMQNVPFPDDVMTKLPRYDLIDDENTFQLSVDVPGVKMEDIDISLDDGFLTVRGQRVASKDISRLTSKFSQSFLLDPSVDVDNFSATLDHGVLVVTAPKNMKKLEENIRKIPIMMAAGSDSRQHVLESKDVASIEAGKAEESDTIDLDKVPSGEESKVEQKEESASTDTAFTSCICCSGVLGWNM